MSAIKERPMLFNGAMVRALLDGSKTQTRRAVKPQPVADSRFSGGYGILPTARTEGATLSVEAPYIGLACPHGQTGDRLWVRENFAWGVHAMAAKRVEDGPFVYAATDSKQSRLQEKWKPSIHMPRFASRITLEIVSVRVERLHDISEADALAEGIAIEAVKAFIQVGITRSASFAYRDLWESISSKSSWDLNPWVWVIEFKRRET